MDMMMKNLKHMFSMGDNKHLIFAVVIFLITVTLTALHRKMAREDKLTLWRLLCLVPLGLSAVHFAVFFSGEAWSELLVYWAALYIPAVVVALWGLFGIWKFSYPLLAILANASALIIGIAFNVPAAHVGNFTRQSYSEAFVSTCDYLEEHYVLADWKQIDFEAIKAELLPEVEKAEQEQDVNAYYAAVEKLAWYMHDAHVAVYPYSGTNEYRPTILSTAKDYGFCMVTLDNGTTIAVNTEPDSEAYKAGICDGAVILSWDGVPIDTAKAEVRCTDYSRPVASNEAILQPIYLSATGAESVEVGFIDKNGTQKTARINAMSYSEAEDRFPAKRLRDTLFELNHVVVEGDENYSTKMLTDNCGYLRLNAESYSLFADKKAYLIDDHEPARELFRQKLRELRDQGMTCLVIDLRNNSGGYDVIGCALAELFTTESFVSQGLGVIKDGSYVRVADHIVTGDGEFADIEVVALTNMECASAGDGTALYLANLENVTLAGISDPSGCDQEVGGDCFLPDGIAVSFPVGLVLNENNEPNIDTAADRVSRDPVEVRIPFDEEAARRIFADEEDYELEWAIEFLKNAK